MISILLGLVLSAAAQSAETHDLDPVQPNVWRSGGNAPAAVDPSPAGPPATARPADAPPVDSPPAETSQPAAPSAETPQQAAPAVNGQASTVSPPTEPRLPTPTLPGPSTPDTSPPAPSDTRPWMSSLPCSTTSIAGRVQASRMFGNDEYNNLPYGSIEEKIRYFAVSFRDCNSNERNLLDAAVECAQAFQGDAFDSLGVRDLKPPPKDNKSELKSSQPTEVVRLNLQTGRLFRTRLAKDRYLVLCCINDSRSVTEGDVACKACQPELICVVIRLEGDRITAHAIIPKSLTSSDLTMETASSEKGEADEAIMGEDGPSLQSTPTGVEVVSSSAPTEGVSVTLPLTTPAALAYPAFVGGGGPIQASIRTGGFTVEIFAELLPSGEVGFRFLKPH